MDFLDASGPVEALMARAFLSTMLHHHMGRHLDRSWREDEEDEEMRSDWDGLAFSKGSPVRFRPGLKRPRHGWQGTAKTDVGRVRSRDENGCVHVRFPHGSIMMEPSEIVLAEDCTKIQPGATVRVRPEITDPRFDWGPVDPASVGLVRKVADDGEVEVDFAEAASEWKCLLNEIEVIPDDAEERARLNIACDAKVGLYSFPIGSAVRVKPSVLEPRHDWGHVRPGCVGRVAGAAMHNAQILVNFPEADHWRAHPEDIEIVPMADAIRPDTRVRLRKSGGHTRYDMPEGVNHDTVARVVQVSYDGQVMVKFEHLLRSHTFHLKELEPADWASAPVTAPVASPKKRDIAPVRFPDPSVLGILCPITLGVMEEPCVAEDGETYDRGAVMGYFKQLRACGQPIRSPLTNQPMGTNLIPNRAMQRLIDEVQQRKPTHGHSGYASNASSVSNSKDAASSKPSSSSKKSGKRQARGPSSNIAEGVDDDYAEEEEELPPRPAKVARRGKASASASSSSANIETSPVSVRNTRSTRRASSRKK